MKMSRVRPVVFMVVISISSFSTLSSASILRGITGRLPESPSHRVPKWSQSGLSASSVVVADWMLERENVAQQCAADLFALFGGEVAASAVEAVRQKKLLDCVRILAPDSICNPSNYFLPAKVDFYDAQQLEAMCGEDCRGEHGSLKKLIASPPPAVEELARMTVEWGGDPSVILSSLDPMKYPVPDVEGSKEERCTLTKYDDGQRFAKKEITKYMAFLFEAIAKLSPEVGLDISLSRFDLFHGHMFTAHDTGRLGILFHSKEYPAYDEKTFPLNLGFCQKGSPVPYDASTALRNIVWLAPMPDCSPEINISGQRCSKKWLASGSLFILDTSQGNILDLELVPEYLDVVHTVSEDDLGVVMLDVNYFNFSNETEENRIFLC